MTTPAVHRWKSAEYVQEWVLVLLPSLLSEARTLASLRRRLAAARVESATEESAPGGTSFCGRIACGLGITMTHCDGFDKLRL